MTSELNDVPQQTGGARLYDTNVAQTWQEKWQELVHYRSLLKNSVIRDVKVRYKNSFLGILWSLLNPLLMMVVYTVLFTILIPNNSIRMYPIFILVALIPWQFFSGSLMGGAVSITSNASLVRKVYFPRIMLPTSVLLSNLVNFLLAFSVLLVLLFGFGIGLTIHALWVPPILLTQLIFMLGLMMLLGTVHVFYRDVVMVLDVVILAWFFLTPIFYPFERLGESATIMGITFSPAVVMRWLNPMASIIDGYRTVLWGTENSNGPVSMDPSYLLRTFVTAVIVFVIGYFVFQRYEQSFAEKL
ncbi:MAG: ABC transporter permease [Anaerolineae bacterium]|nr:ABC transporter permease [Anaerolineae bacterium]